jgi:hypothetical protein
MAPGDALSVINNITTAPSQQGWITVTTLHSTGMFPGNVSMFYWMEIFCAPHQVASNGIQLSVGPLLS